MLRAGFLKTAAEFSKVGLNDAQLLHKSALIAYLGSECFCPLLESSASTRLKHHVPPAWPNVSRVLSSAWLQHRVKDAQSGGRLDETEVLLFWMSALYEVRVRLGEVAQNLL